MCMTRRGSGTHASFVTLGPTQFQFTIARNPDIQGPTAADFTVTKIDVIPADALIKCGEQLSAIRKVKYRASKQFTCERTDPT